MYIMIICACTIDAAARAGVYYMHIHIGLNIYTGICNRTHMHARMQGTRSCACAHYVMLTERGRSYHIHGRGRARASQKPSLYVHIYIYIHIQEHICESVHACMIERERDACAPRLRECMDRCMHACTCTHAGTPRPIAHACGHTLNYI